MRRVLLGVSVTAFAVLLTAGPSGAQGYQPPPEPTTTSTSTSTSSTSTSSTTSTTKPTTTTTTTQPGGGVGGNGQGNGQGNANCSVTPAVVTAGNTATGNCSNLPKQTGMQAVLNSTPIFLGTFTSDANGNLNVTFSTGGLDVGNHTFTVAGGGVTASASFTVVAASGGAGLARTGTGSTLPLARIALALLAVGGLVLLVASRRRLQHTA